MSMTARSAPPPLRLRLPATSANLGAGFDAAACALELWLEIEARAARRPSLLVRGRDGARCASPQHNLLLETYFEVLAEANAPSVPLALRVRNEIPIGKGCGSSAAARLAGILLAVHFGGLGWRAEEIVAEAARREGHGDNVAACWQGGFVVAAPMGDGEPRWTFAGAAPSWPLLLAVPREPLPTEVARALLPASYSRPDAVGNVQAAMLLAAAFMQDRREYLAAGMRDLLHEPYRRERCPLLAALKPLAGGRPIAGVCLSGAGPAVLLVPARGHAATARRQAAAALRAAGLRAELIATRLAARGARHSWRGRS